MSGTTLAKVYYSKNSVPSIIIVLYEFSLTIPSTKTLFSLIRMKIVQHGLTQLAGASIAIGGSFLTQYYGWRYTMIVPGAVTIAVSFILRLVIRDSPQEAGLSSVEASKLQSPIKKVQSEDERSSVREILFKYVLSDPNIYLLSGNLLFIVDTLREVQSFKDNVPCVTVAIA
jgi:hypothetical protein